MIGLMFAVATLLGDPSVFGIKLGAPSPLPECIHAMIISERSPDLYDFVQPKTCREKANRIPDEQFERGWMHFPTKIMPDVVTFPMVSTIEIDGNVEQVEFNTFGHDLMSDVIAQLSTKYGAPTGSRPSLSIIEGIGVPMTDTLWVFANMAVEYRSIGPSMEAGVVTVTTSKGFRALMAGIDRRNAAKTPL